MARIKSGDEVYVIAGDDRGKKGVVRRVDPKKGLVLVEGVNTCLRHVKPSAKNPEGGRVSQEAFIHISNVALANPGAQGDLGEGISLTTRIGYRLGDDGRKVRFAKKTNENI
jgi:large subunit ribosomal protein L24